MTKGKKTGGRVRGTPNRATAELRALAQGYTGRALETLASIMLSSSSDQARIAAARELLDRGHGNPQPLPMPGPAITPASAVLSLPEYEAAVRELLEQY